MRAGAVSPLLLVCALVCAFCPHARAWDPIGHMIVAQSAWDHLTPAAKSRVTQSIDAFNAKNHTNYTFVTAACWMDDIRGKHRQFRTWHYIDLPYNREGMPLPVAWQVNALWGIRLTQDILTGKRTEPGLDKNQALVMLTHLVGDIHQPLHTISRDDDAGGNGVAVPNIKDPMVEIFPKWKNLHYFWDGAYRRKFEDGNVVEIYSEPQNRAGGPDDEHARALPLVRKQTAALEKIYSPEEHPADGDPTAWVKESHAIGYTQGYKNLPGGDAANPAVLDKPYVDAARTISQQRLIQAGHRLANMLNEIYK